MVLRLKNFNISWGSLKTWPLRGVQKNIERGDCLKSGIGQFAKGGLDKKEWVMFLRGFDTPIHAMILGNQN